jgi:hypothetical protein
MMSAFPAGISRYVGADFWSEYGIENANFLVAKCAIWTATRSRPLRSDVNECHTNMTPALRSRRTVFWTGFIAAAAVCFALAVPGSIQRHKAMRTVEILRPLLAADPRFARVQAVCTTIGRAYLNGWVNSAEDLAALQRLVGQAQLPSPLGWSVAVEPAGPNHAAGGNAESVPVAAERHWPGVAAPIG